jgi:hypothetical protein
MRKQLWIVAASCTLLLAAYFGYRSYQLNTQPWIMASASAAGAHMMTIAEYEKYVLSGDGFIKSFERVYPGSGLQSASQKKLAAAKSRASNQTLLALLFAGLAALGFLKAFLPKAENPEAAAERPV